MKKLTSLMMAAALAVSITACGATANTNATASSATDKSTATAEAGNDTVTSTSLCPIRFRNPMSDVVFAMTSASA